MENLTVKYVTPDCIQLVLLPQGLEEMGKNLDGEFNWLLDELGDHDICLANEINRDSYNHLLINESGHLFEFTENDMVTLKESALSGEFAPLELNMVGDLENWIDRNDEADMDFYNWYQGNG